MYATLPIPYSCDFKASHANYIYTKEGFVQHIKIKIKKDYKEESRHEIVVKDQGEMYNTMVFISITILNHYMKLKHTITTFAPLVPVRDMLLLGLKSINWPYFTYKNYLFGLNMWTKKLSERLRTMSMPKCIQSQTKCMECPLLLIDDKQFL